LKLLDAIESVREALKAGAIDVGHAVELARLAPAQQVRMLSWLDVGFIYKEPHEVEEEDGFARAGESDDDDFDDDDVAPDDPSYGERGVCKYCSCTEDDPCVDCDPTCSWANEEHTVCRAQGCLAEWNEDGGSGESLWHPTRWSLAQLRAEIARTTLKVLTDAPFPLDDEIPPMACTECPKRSGNAALLFADCAQDTCTDRECFDGKVRAWVRSEIERSEEQKRPLLMLADGYSGAKGAIPDYSIVRTDREGACDRQEEAIWISGARTGHRTMICRDAKCKTHKGEGARVSSSSSRVMGPDPEKAKADRKKLLAKLESEKKYRAALFAAVAMAPVVPLYGSDLNLEVCLYAIGRGPGQYEKKVAEALSWPEGIFGWGSSKQLRERVAKLAPIERLRVALVAAHAGELGVSEYASTSKPEELEKLAELLGLDVKQIRAKSEGKPQPTVKAVVPAKPVIVKAPKPARKTVAKPVAKKATAKPATKKPAKKAAKKAGRR
jgi:hypothetical protein